MLSHSTTIAIYSAYVGLLAATCLASLFQKRSDFVSLWNLISGMTPMRRTATAMFMNWAVSTAFVIATGWHDAWAWFILVDSLAAAVVLYQPAGKPQAFIGAFYLAAIIVSGVYATSPDKFAETAYWLVLISIAILQLSVLGGWNVGHRLRYYLRPADHRVAGREGEPGMA